MPQSEYTFEQFYKAIGFIDYPFATFSTESEGKIAKDLYVRPQNYSVITQLFTTGASSIIHGERGTGKTALASELVRSVSDQPRLFIVVDDFKDLSESYKPCDLYRALTNRISECFFSWLAKNPSRSWRLTRPERIYLSYYLQHHVRPASKEVLRSEIFKIQNPWYIRCSVGLFNQTRGLLNYGLNACAAFGNDVLTRHFPGIPGDNSRYKEYLEEMSIKSDTSYDIDQHEFRSLERICGLIRKCGIEKISIKIDKLDEDSRFNNSAEDISDFIKNIACDNALLLNDNFQFILFLWTTPFNYIKDSVRTQKLNVQKLEWSKNDLLKALDNRVGVFSRGIIQSHKLFIDVSDAAFEKIIELSNFNPRDLWHIIDKCMQAQHRIDSKNRVIQPEAMRQGAIDFVKKFNFYEYYPKKSNARANSLDIYSYIKHLSKLSKFKFTKDQFNREAGTGSSTNNYITAMENIGLIVRSEEKESGAAAYKIKDPKVIFALENAIDISRES